MQSLDGFYKLTVFNRQVPEPEMWFNFPLVPVVQAAKGPAQTTVPTALTIRVGHPSDDRITLMPGARSIDQIQSHIPCIRSQLAQLSKRARMRAM